MLASSIAESDSDLSPFAWLAAAAPWGAESEFVALEVPSAELRMIWSLSMGVGPVGAVLAVGVELPDPLSVLSEATAAAPACKMECVKGDPELLDAVQC